MDLQFKITYTAGFEEYSTTAESKEEAERVAAQLFDDGYEDIKISSVRV